MRYDDSYDADAAAQDAADARKLRHTDHRSDVDCPACVYLEQHGEQCDECGDLYIGEHDCREAGETIFRSAS